jgi:ABC-type phosphate transport system ATPase subunit
MFLDESSMNRNLEEELVRAISKSGTQLSIFGKSTELRGLRRFRNRRKVKNVKGEFRYQEDNKYYHRFRIETKNEEILGAIYISKNMDPLPDRIILDRKRS